MLRISAVAVALTTGLLLASILLAGQAPLAAPVVQMNRASYDR